MIDINILKQTVEQKMRNALIPGLAISVIHGNEIIYSRGFGTTSVDDGVPVTENTLFRIGSISKVLTGTLAMKLVEEGKLILDQPIIEYVPFFKLHDQEYTKIVTMRMLLSHTSGLPTGVTEYYRTRSEDGLKQNFNELHLYPLMFKPGTTWCYSDKGLDAAAYIMEFICQKPFNDLITEKVFKPLNMSRTTFDPLVAMTYPFAQAHIKNENGTLSVRHKALENTREYGSGFAMSTVSDLSKLVQMYMGVEDNHGFLSQDTISKMFTIHGKYYMPNQSGYGLTFEVENYKKIKRIWHDGLIAGYGSWLYFSPQEKVAVVLLTNWTSGFWDNAIDIINSIFDDLLDLTHMELDIQYKEPKKELWKDLIGTYVGPWTGLVDVYLSNQQLYLRFNNDVYPLSCIEDNLYEGKLENHEPIYIGFINQNDVMVNGIPCERTVSTYSVQVNSEVWDKYVGTYELVEKASYKDCLTFSIFNHTFICFDENQKEDHKCTIINNKRLSLPGHLIDFVFDEQDNVIGLWLDKTRYLKKIKS